MVRGRLITICVVASMLFSCRASRSAMSPVKPSGLAEDYIETYKGLAVSEMKRTGVPASITLAQGLIESGMGTGTIAVEANNHFGIKCHDDWDGPIFRHTDDRRNECFRKYKSPAESYRDHSDFLKQTPRYNFLFDLPVTDYKGWARGLKKAGYATNPDYANMVIEKIELYGLNKYDNGISEVKEGGNRENNEIKADIRIDSPETGYNGSENGGVITFKTLPERIQENNRIQYIVVNERDSRDKVEKELNLLRWELPKYNELERDFTITPGQILYLQPKRDKAEPGKETHIVKEGETMYQISQIYGIKIKKLYLMNRMEEGTEPASGQKVWLRSTKPVD